MQALSESKKKGSQSQALQPNLTEEQDDSSPTEGSIMNGLAKSKQDPDQQIQMSSVQSLITL